ncbi:hypothetical protein, partial [Klebsiella pneumoniae]|uniref:hypothetical protein n=1 Tax=Klebsiella pneumoniae TaxID=573 RepID=UPI001D0E4617
CLKGLTTILKSFSYLFSNLKDFYPLRKKYSVRRMLVVSFMLGILGDNLIESPKSIRAPRIQCCLYLAKNEMTKYSNEEW